MKNDPMWKKFKFRVVLSDANSPGEGEHKIMNFIRSQRFQPGPAHAAWEQSTPSVYTPRRLLPLAALPAHFRKWLQSAHAVLLSGGMGITAQRRSSDRAAFGKP